MSYCRTQIGWKLKTLTLSILLALAFAQHGQMASGSSADAAQAMAYSLASGDPFAEK